MIKCTCCGSTKIKISEDEFRIWYECEKCKNKTYKDKK